MASCNLYIFIALCARSALGVKRQTDFARQSELEPPLIKILNSLELPGTGGDLLPGRSPQSESSESDLSWLDLLNMPGPQSDEMEIPGLPRPSDTSLLEIPGLRNNAFTDLAHGKVGGAVNGMTWKMPEKGFDERLKNVSKLMPTTCDEKMNKISIPTPDPNICSRTQKLVDLLVNKVCVGPEPNITWTMTVQGVLALNYYLYFPGTLLAFQSIDRDDNGAITKEEMYSLFPLQTTMAVTTGVWDFMDTRGGETEATNNMTRADLTAFMHACIMLRDYLPEVDVFDPTASTQKCMMMSQRVLKKPVAPVQRLGKWEKLGLLVAFMVGAFALHCFFCSGRFFKAGLETGEAQLEKEVPAAKKADL